MKISLNWLKQYIEFDHKPEDLGNILTMTGLEVEGIEEHVSIPGGLQGLVAGKVLTCEQHPNADRLKITTVDIGGNENPQIVCGAPNVAAGQTVVVAPVGTTIYPTSGDPFVIKKAKIRGEVSEGMICAEDEIGLGDDHDGIVQLSDDILAGTEAAPLFEVEHDHIIEIGLTPNRGDGASHIGAARDLRAVFNRDITWPDISNFAVDNTDNTIPVIVENNEGCPRYSAVTISGITVRSSPNWLQNRLRSIGLAPINNVVDITNFVLHETGQPLHAFDADQITGGEVLVKTLPEGSKFTTLDEVERSLKATDLMICNSEGGMCIAGVFGGTKSGITENTKNVFLESAYFSPDYTRRSSQIHGLKTDAAFRFERGTDPNMTVFALKRAAMLIKEIAGGEISSDIIDEYPNPIENKKITVKYSHISRLIGQEIEKTEIHRILNCLDIATDDQAEEGFTAVVPPYRSDVTREADVIEEILRIYGFNNIDLPESVSASSLANFPALDKDEHQNRVAYLLSARGFNEIWTNSLTKPANASLLSSINPAENVVMLNALSEDLAVLRQSLLFSGLETVAHNINRQQTNLKLFEFGKRYKTVGDGFEENSRLAIFLTGKTMQENWREEVRGAEYHDLALTTEVVIASLIKGSISRETFSDDEFVYGTILTLDNKELGRLGLVNPSLTEKFDVNQELFYCDLNWDLLLQKTNPNIVFEEVSKFPAVKRDLSLVIDSHISFEEIRNLAAKQGASLLKELRVFDVYEGESIGEGKKAYAVSFFLQDEHKTLTDKIIDKVMNKMITTFENELGATIRI